ncbi:MAG: AbgT family transporter, partial [Planctomycetota bacterium]
MTEQPQTPSPKEKRDRETGARRTLFNRFLAFVEWLGNLLPHPVTLFALIAVLIVLVSGLCGVLGVQVDDPRPPGAAGRDPSGMIVAKSL